MTRPHWRDAAKEKFWRRMLQRWRRSGLTVRAFCEQHELSEGSFYAWRRIIAERDQEATRAKSTTATASFPQTKGGPGEAGAARPAFVQVDIAGERSVPDGGAASPAGSASESIELVVGCGRVVRLRRGFDAALLRQVLRVLEEPTC
jgi:hypothetical protein